jgi:hypothetical protein
MGNLGNISYNKLLISDFLELENSMLHLGHSA